MRYLTPLLSFVLIPLLITTPLSAQIIENSGGSADSAPSQDLQIRVIAGDTGSAPVNSQAASGLTVEVTGADGVAVADAAVALRVPDMEPTGVFPDSSHAVVAYTDQSGHAHLPAVKWGGTPGVVAIRVTAVKGTAHAGILVEEKLLATSAIERPSKSEGGADSQSAASRLLGTLDPSNGLEPLPPAPPAQIKPAAAAAPVAQSTPNTSASTHPLAPAASALKPEPSVSVTSSVPPGAQTHSHKKWIVIAAIAAGAGAGLAFAGRGKSGGSSSPAPSLTIGAPTVSVGHP